MPQKPLTPAEVKDFLIRAHACGLAKVKIGGGLAGGDPNRTKLADVARRMNTTVGAVKRFCYDYAPRYGWDPMRPETWNRNEPDQPLDEKERARYAGIIEKLRGELKRAYRSANASDDLREAVFGLAKAPITAPKINVSRAPGKGSSPDIPILFTSDFQWGERISPAQLDGVNEFNLQVARDRYELLITKAIDITRWHAGRKKADRIVYLRGGDMISGDIHEELRETNAAMSIPQVVDLVENEVAGLQALRSVFDRIDVISVPGNHGRITVKPHSKGYAEANYDTLSAWMLEREFRNDPGVQFHTPASGDAIFEVCGWTFCMTHGDRIGSRGGQGFIGPAATIARGMKKNADYWASCGVHIDYQLVGHFHTSLELEQGFANGSLPGISEYARDFRMRPGRASQWLLFVHPDHGVSSRWPIYLSEPVKAKGGTQAFQFLKAAYRPTVTNDTRGSATSSTGRFASTRIR